MNLIKDKIPVLGLDIIERRTSYYYINMQLIFQINKSSRAFNPFTTFRFLQEQRFTQPNAIYLKTLYMMKN